MFHVHFHAEKILHIRSAEHKIIGIHFFTGNEYACLGSHLFQKPFLLLQLLGEVSE